MPTLPEENWPELAEALRWFDVACRRSGFTNAEIGDRINVDRPETISRYRSRASAPTQGFIQEPLIEFVRQYVDLQLE